MQVGGALRRRHRRALLSKPSQPDGLLRQFYSSDEIDAYAAYCPTVDRCYFLPIETFANRIAIQLRLGPTKNNQSSRINWAKDYEFAARLGRPGAVAQLGERCHGMAEVRGSSPLGSIDQLHLLR
jgi:hypothetical protein